MAISHLSLKTDKAEEGVPIQDISPTSLIEDTHTSSEEVIDTLVEEQIKSDKKKEKEDDDDILYYPDDECLYSEDEEVSNVNDNPVESKTIKLIKHLKSVCASPRETFQRKFQVIEQAMNYLQREAAANEGCINELGFNSKGTLDEVNMWEEQGSGLLPYIQKCLRNDTRYANVIRWTNKKELEFKIVDPERFAKMWGQEKRKEGMTKRKLTRSLAYLVNTKRKLKRSASRQFVYLIVPKSERSTAPSPVPSVSSECSSNIASPAPRSLLGSPCTTPSSPPQQPTKTFTKAELLNIIQQNPEYREMLYKKLKLMTGKNQPTQPSSVLPIGLKRPSYPNDSFNQFSPPTKLHAGTTCFSTNLQQEPINWRSVITGSCGHVDYQQDLSPMSNSSNEVEPQNCLPNPSFNMPYLFNNNPSMYHSERNISTFTPTNMPQVNTQLGNVSHGYTEDLLSINPTFTLTATTGDSIETLASNENIDTLASIYL